LGERRVRNAEVEGSSPFGSTNFNCIFRLAAEFCAGGFCFWRIQINQEAIFEVHEPDIDTKITIWLEK
jgi:hypothetical protein